jgi:chaperonin cofactor prefoldin
MGKKKKEKIKLWIILLIILLVLLFVITWGNANFLSGDIDDEKTSLKERKLRLDTRYKKVQQVLDRKKSLKIKLETLCKRVLFGVRVGLVVLLFIVIYVLNLYWKFSFLDMVGYFGGGALAIFVLGFIFVGKSTTIFTLWRYCEQKLTLMIYGKYIDIDKHIEWHEKELEKITTDKSEIDKELKEIEEAENEIRRIIEENNSNNT